jgi:hypothetical protein
MYKKVLYFVLVGSFLSETSVATVSDQVCLARLRTALSDISIIKSFIDPSRWICKPKDS